MFFFFTLNVEQLIREGFVGIHLGSGVGKGHSKEKTKGFSKRKCLLSTNEVVYHPKKENCLVKREGGDDW